MIRVQFNDKLSMQTVEFATVSENIVQLTGDKIPHSTAGFKAYRLNGRFLGDYSEYTNIVKEEAGMVQLGKE